MGRRVKNGDYISEFPVALSGRFDTIYPAVSNRQYVNKYCNNDNPPVASFTPQPKRKERMKIRTSPRGGFTLIEIMIVVAIIALLATVAIPSLVKARSTAQAQGCITNLQTIDGAKTPWALEKNKGGDATPTEDDLKPYIKLNSAGNIPGCPASGTYTIGSVNAHPTCSYGNATPPHKIP